MLETDWQTTHYNDVIMGTIASQITSLTIVYSTIYSDADQRKHQSSASLAFVRGIHREPVNSVHKWPVTRRKFPLDDVIMLNVNEPTRSDGPQALSNRFYTKPDTKSVYSSSSMLVRSRYYTVTMNQTCCHSVFTQSIQLRDQGLSRQYK